MFREGERLEIVRGAILVANQATRAKAKRDAGETPDRPTSSEAVATFDAAMAKLEVLQQGDFEGIFRAMDGLPVVIRLIDPPLHEFLPNLEEQLVKVTRAEEHGGASEEDKELLATIKALHEQNPMLGLRGCRLGLMIPDFVKVQTRAILNAQIAVKRSRRPPDRQDHDPARRARERARRDPQAARGRGEGRRGQGRRRWRRGRLQVRDDDRGPARRPDRRRDRPRGRLLQLRHERPDPDDVRLQPRRRRGRVPAQVRRGRHPAGQPVPDARRRGRRA